MSCLRESLNFLEALGLRVKMGENVSKTNGYLAGTDKERLEDFHQMIKIQR